MATSDDKKRIVPTAVASRARFAFRLVVAAGCVRDERLDDRACLLPTHHELALVPGPDDLQ